MKITKMLKINTLLAAGILTLAFSLPSSGALALPQSDARIKTLVYNDNEIFRVVARSGFQTDIELAVDESIDTLSIGDSVGWQITPATHRIFVKPLQRSGITNLTVITNKHNYQFELVASNPVSARPDHAYVVRFYYPDQDAEPQTPIDRTRNSLRPISPDVIPDIPTPVPPALPPVVTPSINIPPPMMPPVMPGDTNAKSFSMLGNEGYNFNYTLSGPESLAPSKIYDDGKSTFFQFKTPPSPAYNYSVVNSSGTETPVPTRVDSDGKIVIDQLAGKFIIRNGSDVVCVFNEQGNPMSVSSQLPPPLPTPASLPSPSAPIVPQARR